MVLLDGGGDANKPGNSVNTVHFLRALRTPATPQTSTFRLFPIRLSMCTTRTWAAPGAGMRRCRSSRFDFREHNRCHQRNASRVRSTGARGSRARCLRPATPLIRVDSPVHVSCRVSGRGAQPVQGLSVTLTLPQRWQREDCLFSFGSVVFDQRVPTKLNVDLACESGGNNSDFGHGHVAERRKCPSGHNHARESVRTGPNLVLRASASAGLLSAICSESPSSIPRFAWGPLSFARWGVAKCYQFAQYIKGVV